MNRCTGPESETFFDYGDATAFAYPDFSKFARGSLNPLIEVALADIPEGLVPVRRTGRVALLRAW